MLGVPCITIRINTEQPATVEVGTSEVVGNDPAKIIDAAECILAGKCKQGGIPEGWDDQAGKRIVTELEKYLQA